MGWAFAALYDLQMALAGRRSDRWRRAVVGDLEGRILELGIGTGQNVPLYPPDSFVVGVDPDRVTLGRARRRAAGNRRSLHLAIGKGEALPFQTGTFDGVVASMVLCSVSDQAAALAEIRRVLRPAGRFRFLEHVRSDGPGWSRIQDLLTPVCTALGG